MSHHLALDVEEMDSSYGPIAPGLTRRRLLSQTPIAMSCATALRGQSGEPKYVEAATVNGRVRGMKHPGLVTSREYPAVVLCQERTASRRRLRRSRGPGCAVPSNSAHRPGTTRSDSRTRKCLNLLEDCSDRRRRAGHQSSKRNAECRITRSQ